jgi:hypothetical protein
LASGLSQANSIIAAFSHASYGKMEIMARKRKPKRFSKVEAVKALARERIGKPPSSRVVPDRKKKTTEKHKPTLGKLLNEN